MKLTQDALDGFAGGSIEVVWEGKNMWRGEIVSAAIKWLGNVRTIEFDIENATQTVHGEWQHSAIYKWVMGDSLDEFTLEAADHGRLVLTRPSPRKQIKLFPPQVGEIDPAKFSATSGTPQPA